MSEEKERKLGYEDFFKMAIVKLRDTSKSRGIHSVFSGFNEAFRQYFDEDPIRVTQELAKEGKIEIRPVKKGVMIYLPGEAPGERGNLGKTALSKILNQPQDRDRSLLEESISELLPGGPKVFPEDFIEGKTAHDRQLEIQVPGTPLQLDSNSETVVVSPRRHFRYEAKNPAEAKFIVYAHKIGQKRVEVPKDSRVVFKAVKNYELYCRDVKSLCFTFFLNRTNDEDIAELLTKEAVHRFDLRSQAHGL